MVDFIFYFSFFAILTTPAIAFVIVRKLSLNIWAKVLLGVLITVLLAVVFFRVVINIAHSDE
jgi:hypothetical protein